MTTIVAICLGLGFETHVTARFVVSCTYSVCIKIWYTAYGTSFIVHVVLNSLGTGTTTSLHESSRRRPLLSSDRRVDPGHRYVYVGHQSKVAWEGGVNKDNTRAARLEKMTGSHSPKSISKFRQICLQVRGCWLSSLPRPRPTRAKSSG